MNKKALIALVVIGFLGVVALLVLKSYATDLVHVAVMNSVIQKAPDDYSENTIRQAFRESYRSAEESGAEETYLEKLKVLAHRLEKMQHLEEDEVEKILRNLKAE